jgi:hypothetical protein
MSNSKNELVNINSLLRIQQVRLTKDEKNFREAQQKYQMAEKLLDERQNNILVIKKQIKDTYDYMTLSTSRSSPERINRGDAYLFWLNYDLDMHEYYFSQEKDRVNEAKKNYKIAKKHWYKRKIKIKKLKETYLYKKNMINTNKEAIEEENIYEIGLTKGK